MNTDINWAIKQKTSVPCKSVLFILANRADRNHRCFPSLSRLATDTGLSRRTVIRCIQQLETLGLIRREMRGIETTIYTLLLGTACHQQEGQPVTTQHAEVVTQSPVSGDRRAKKVVTQWHTEPKEEEPKGNPKRGSARARKRAATTPPPDVFEITPSLIVWAAKENITANITEETAKMLDHFRGNGGLKADWPATWRNWMRNADTFNRRRNGGNRNGSRKPTDWEKNVAALQTFVNCELVTEMCPDVPDVRKDPR